MLAKIKYTSSYKEDLSNILIYQVFKFRSRTSALNLLLIISEKTKLVAVTPEAYPVYKQDNKNKKNKIRTFKVKNYTIFYKYDKKKNAVEFLRIVYSRRDFSKILRIPK